MEYRLIQCEEHFDGAVFKIVLNSPKANILEAAMLREISAALDGLGTEKDVKLIVFEGDGKHFSFGASVQEHTKDNAAMMLKAFHGVFYQLVRLGRSDHGCSARPVPRRRHGTGPVLQLHRRGQDGNVRPA